jgi:hypothetical protein
MKGLCVGEVPLFIQGLCFLYRDVSRARAGSYSVWAVWTASSIARHHVSAMGRRRGRADHEESIPKMRTDHKTTETNSPTGHPLESLNFQINLRL